LEPNIVPPEAQIWYYIRAPRRREAAEIYERVVKIAEGAALMTGTTFDIEFMSGCSDFVRNDVLTRLLEDLLNKVGPPKYPPEAWELARELEAAFAPGQKEKVLHAFSLPPEMNKLILHEGVQVFGEGKILAGSTDVGDVSYVTPTAQVLTCCAPLGTAAHSWQFTAAAGSVIGHQGMAAAAKVLALAGVELLAKPQILKDARKEFNEMIEQEGAYESPLPADMKPPLDALKH
jgi:aminobenzoyl-glutamate utilization protein B